MGNAPLLFLVFALTFINPTVLNAWTPLIQIIIYSTMFGGGVLAGFLVSRTVLNRYLAVGLITGAFCYLLNMVYSLFMLQFLLAKSFSEYLQLLFYVLGGLLGGLLRQILRGRRKGGVSPTS